MKKPTPKKLTRPEIANAYEDMIVHKKMEWLPISEGIYKKLHHWTRAYLDWFKEAGIKCELGRTSIQGTLVLKTDDPVICYFEHHPNDGIHQWVGPDYFEALSSNEAIAYLVSKRGMDRDQAMKLLELCDKIAGIGGEDTDPETN